MKIAITLLCITLILGQTIRFPGGVLPTDLVVAATIGYWVFFETLLSKKNSILRLPKIQIILILSLIAWTGASLFFNLHTLPLPQLFGPASYYLRMTTYLLLVIPYASWFSQNSKKYLGFWENSLLWTTGILVILGFLQLIFIPDFSFMAQYGWDPHMGRLLTTWYDPNFFAGFLSITTPLFLATSLEDFRQKTVSQKTWVRLSIITISIVAVILTFSRSGLLAYLMGVLVVLTIYSPLSILGLSLGLGGVLAGNERFRERVMGIFQVDVTASLRIQSWVKTIQDIQDSAWIGIGYNTLSYQNIVAENLNSSSGRDSSLLTIWLTTGIVGLLLVVGILFERVITFLQLIQNASPQFRAWGVAGLGVLAAILVHSMFVNSMTYVHILGILIMYLSIQYDPKNSPS